MGTIPVYTVDPAKPRVPYPAGSTRRPVLRPEEAPERADAPTGVGATEETLARARAALKASEKAAKRAQTLAVQADKAALAADTERKARELALRKQKAAERAATEARIAQQLYDQLHPPDRFVEVDTEANGERGQYRVMLAQNQRTVLRLGGNIPSLHLRVESGILADYRLTLPANRGDRLAEKFPRVHWGRSLHRIGRVANTTDLVFKAARNTWITLYWQPHHYEWRPD